ncbi:MAG TPA: DUF4097 family beta strand repeat-containing protein [Gaiellaceae bacterium]|nr:DUF4097 family beta strand repeat-containing protein [Gaiellaceae bacterium]
MHSFSTPEPPRLRVRVPAGSVSLDTAESHETTVELEPLRNDEVTREAIDNATVEQRGDRIVVEIAKGGWGFFGRSPQIGVHVRCPHGTSLDCDTASADVFASGRLGDVEVKSASADVFLDHVTGTMSVTSASGDVRVDQLDGDGRITTVSGDARVDAARGELAANTVSGDLELGELHRSVTAQTVSGDQRLRSIRAGEIQLKSVSGDVAVGVLMGTRLFIDANSTSGDVRSELDVGDKPAEGNGSEASLRVKTVSGDIAVTRAV